MTRKLRLSQLSFRLWARTVRPAYSRLGESRLASRREQHSLPLQGKKLLPEKKREPHRRGFPKAATVTAAIPYFVSICTRSSSILVDALVLAFQSSRLTQRRPQPRPHPYPQDTNNKVPLSVTYVFSLSPGPNRTKTEAPSSHFCCAVIFFLAQPTFLSPSSLVI